MAHNPPIAEATLRDLFAGLALAGFMANKARPTTLHADDATWAFTVADALLAERERGQ